MSKKLAIKGHPTRGKEVIKLLEMMGGKSTIPVGAILDKCIYVIIEGNILELHHYFNDFLIFTLEDFLEKYPFKVGDKVYTKSNVEGTIIDMFWDGIEVLYQLSSESVNALGYFHRNELKSYKEEVNMNENKVKGYCTKVPETCNETKK